MFVGHPRDADGLIPFIVSAFPANEVAVWKQRLEEKQPADFCVAFELDGEWHGCLLAQDLGGNAALIWPPAASRVELDWSPLGHRLFEELRDRNFLYTQSLLAPEKSDAIDCLLAVGMTQLTTMDYLVASVQDAPPCEGGRVEPFTMQHIAGGDLSNESRIYEIVEGTYRDTLDCPELDGIRTVEDVVRGYRASAPLQLWIVQAHEQRDAGILILSDHVEHQQSELTYMGLLPDYRGRGWGRELVQFAITQTKRQGRDKIVLAVDRRNTPAIEQYRRCGFHRWTSRVCLTRNLAPSS